MADVPVRSSFGRTGFASLLLPLLAFWTVVTPALAEPSGSESPSSAATPEALASHLEQDPGDLRLGNELRQACRRQGRADWCIDELNRLVDEHAATTGLRYHAALAYVDYLPGHTILKQGWLSTRSMEHMDAVLEERPDDWLALYIRGLNNLYWPPFYRRTGRAIEDLRRTVDLSEELSPESRPAYHVLGFIALGDALAKDERPDEARRVWKRAAKLWPGTPRLGERLDQAPDKLRDYVLAVRDLDDPIDTDLSFLWNER